MKTKTNLLAIILFLMSGVFALAQTQKDTRNLGNFDAVKVSNSIKVELVRGEENKAEVSASGIDVGNVETSIVGGTLEVRLARGNFKNFNVRVLVTYMDIQGIESLTSSHVVAKDKIVAESAYLFAATSGFIDAEVEATELSVEAATSSRIVVRGEVEQVEAKAFTSAEIDGTRLEVGDATVQANTAATIRLHVTDAITGSAATAAKIFYGGDPGTIDVKTGTGGTVQKK